MNRQPDIDRLLRSWLDEGDDTPPERHVWAALERVETTRQRGALRVSLEEFIMRTQPYASIAAVVVVAAIGLAIYLSLAGAGPNIGDPEETPRPGAVQTEEFGDPVSLVPPDGWVLVEQPNSLVVAPPIGDDPIEEQIAIFGTEGAAIWGGLEEGLMPWPEDLVAWMADYPVVTEESGPGSLDLTVAGESETTVGGEAARVIDATATFTQFPDAVEAAMNYISAEPANLGTDPFIVDGGGPVRFVVLDDRGVVITYHASESLYSEATFQEVLDSIRFTGE